jgi:hypothetical protein
MSSPQPTIGRSPDDDRTPTQARQGDNSGHGRVRSVMLISIFGAIAGMAIAYFALQ